MCPCAPDLCNGMEWPHTWGANKFQGEIVLSYVQRRVTFYEVLHLCCPMQVSEQTPFFQMKKWRLREVKWFLRSHTANGWARIWVQVFWLPFSCLLLPHPVAGESCGLRPLLSPFPPRTWSRPQCTLVQSPAVMSEHGIKFWVSCILPAWLGKLLIGPTQSLTYKARRLILPTSEGCYED